MRDVEALTRDSRVIVTVGAGGVGKTTTAAVLGLDAAMRGRRVLVMTVDPARRLANALGIDVLGHETQRVQIPESFGCTGELSATMLDMKSVFDGIVVRYSRTPDAARRILDNRFYHFFSTSLAGAQELSAGERLFEVCESGDYDLVVLDTPPTSNAIDFINAPVRFFDVLDSSAIQWVLTISGKARGGDAFNIGTQLLQRTLGRFTGPDFFPELGEFLFHFSDLLEGIKERSASTSRLLADPRTSFVIVASPEPNAVHEAEQFRALLAERRMEIGAVVVNRVHSRFATLSDAALTAEVLTSQLERLGGEEVFGPVPPAQLAAKLLRSAAVLKRYARRDDAVLERMRASMGPSVAVVGVPLFSGAIHTMDGLLAMSRRLHPPGAAK